MTDNSQIHDVSGMTPAQINKALKDGRLNDLLSGVEGEGDGKPDVVEQKDAEWLASATAEEIRAALDAGQLQDRLRGED